MIVSTAQLSLIDVNDAPAVATAVGDGVTVRFLFVGPTVTLTVAGTTTTLTSPSSYTVSGGFATFSYAPAMGAFLTGISPATSVDVTAINLQLANIASDNILSQGEKPTLILDTTIITNEASSLDSQAQAFGMTYTGDATRKAYDDAVTALGTYLATLTTPTLWSNLTGNTTIDGPTFRAALALVFTKRIALINALADKAKATADAKPVIAFGTAPGSPRAGDLWVDTSGTYNVLKVWSGSAWAVAQDPAAINQKLADIADDNVLTAGEKPTVILDYTTTTSERAALDSQANAFGMTYALGGARKAYDDAVAALATYLATLASPTLWSTIPGNTTIAGTTFRTTWALVYSTRIDLINALADKAKAAGDAKNSVSFGTSAPTSPAPKLGDLWVDTSTADNVLKQWNGTAWATVQDSARAITELGNIASDSVLAAVEKPQVILSYSVLLAEQAALDSQANAFGMTYALGGARKAFDDAMTALVAYLLGLTSPTAWNVIPGNTTVNGANFRAAWGLAYSTRTDLVNAMANKTKGLADDANGSIVQIVSDGYLTPAEKATVAAWWTTAQAEKTILDAQALSVTVDATDYDAKYAVLAGTTGQWTSAGTTAITVLSPTFLNRWANYWSAKTSLQRVISDKLSTNSKLTLDELRGIASDSTISKGEKAGVASRWDAARGDWTTLSDRAMALGVPYGYLSTAYTALRDVIATCDLSHTLVDTGINGPSFYACWVAWDTAKTRSITALQAVTPSVRAAATASTALTGTSALLVDGASVSTGDKVLLAGNGATDSGIYRVTVTSGNTSGATSWPSTITGDTGSLTDAGNLTDTSLATAGTLFASGDTFNTPKRIVMGGMSGSATSGTLTLKVQALPERSGPAIAWVQAEYSTDGGGIWAPMKTWLGDGSSTLGAGISQTSSAGIDTLTVALTGVSMAQVQTRVVCTSRFSRVRI